MEGATRALSPSPSEKPLAEFLKNRPSGKPPSVNRDIYSIGNPLVVSIRLPRGVMMSCQRGGLPQSPIKPARGNLIR